MARSAILVWSLLVLTASSPLLRGDEAKPRSTDSRLKFELYAESPQIVTPTGVDVDSLGRVWAIESNTHFPPEGYTGHPTDRVLVLEDADRDGKAEKITVFKDGLTHSMSIAVKPVWLDLVNANRLPPAATSRPGASSIKSVLEVYIATRNAIFLCRDLDGDLKCDETIQLVHLETTGNYPHNGLAGFAFDVSGRMYFGFGENVGADYKMIGSDQTTLSGGGEGGSVYRCGADGSKLERWATGFWNPHASCIDAFGRLFTLDNDPDSRPPCRLTHTVQNGDFGYRFRNGRKGTHPFTSWNGEIPGTLPMVSGTGEAPSGIVAYESAGLPSDYIGTLLVGSWGDHRIDKFVLTPRGISFQSIPHPVITGGDNFRPVGLAVAPDGAVYVTDWVLKDYKLHGQGRIWRLSSKDSQSTILNKSGSGLAQPSVQDLINDLHSPILTVRRVAAKTLARTDEGKLALSVQLKERPSDGRLHFEVAHAISDRFEPARDLDWSKDSLADPFVLIKAVHEISRLAAGPAQNLARTSSTGNSLKKMFAEIVKLDSAAVERSARESEYSEIAMLLALRMTFPKEAPLVQYGLKSQHPSCRRLAVQWIGEENLGMLREDVHRVLASEPMTTDLFMACLASLSLLDGVAPREFEKRPPSQYLLAILNSTNRSDSLRATSLRMLSPTDKELDAVLFGDLLASRSYELRREAIRTLQFSNIPERESLLRGIPEDKSIDLYTRADAVAGLACVKHDVPPDEATVDLLLKLVTVESPLPIRLEAVRSLRSLAVVGKENVRVDPKVTSVFRQQLSQIASEPGLNHLEIGVALDFALGSRQSESSQDLLQEMIPEDGAASKQIRPEANKDMVEAGRRTFFHVNGPGCFRCHQVGGRGGQVGPDLTIIARTMDHKKLVESVLQPSKEISPQFTSWVIELKSGKTVTGMLLGEEVNGDLRLGNSQGDVLLVPFNDIETRSPTKTSVMPDNLHQSMTKDELQSLIVYLLSLK